MVLHTRWISQSRIDLFRFVGLYLESLENRLMKIQNWIVSDLETSELMKHKHLFCLTCPKSFSIGSNVYNFVLISLFTLQPFSFKHSYLSKMLAAD